MPSDFTGDSTKPRESFRLTPVKAFISEDDLTGYEDSLDYSTILGVPEIDENENAEMDLGILFAKCFQTTYPDLLSDLGKLMVLASATEMKFQELSKKMEAQVTQKKTYKGEPTSVESLLPEGYTSSPPPESELSALGPVIELFRAHKSRQDFEKKIHGFA
jgi:hypothetical protein